MKKKKNTNPQALRFKVRVVYGFLAKLEIVLLGEQLQGELAPGQALGVRLGEQTMEGGWTLREVLKMDFINARDQGDFSGLVIDCADEAAFKLLQALRVYDEEVLLFEPSPSPGL